MITLACGKHKAKFVSHSLHFQNGLRLSQTLVLMFNNEDMLLQVQVSDEIQSRTAGLSDTWNN